MDDLISRQAAIDSFRYDDDGTAWNMDDIVYRLEQFPSVQPEREKGKWIRKSPTAWSWTCSCCKKDDAYAYSAGESFEPDVLQDLFCPNCGADMRGAERREE